MRHLQNIDIAFICMNLPYTMDVQSAASAVLDFNPKIVFPFHYRGAWHNDCINVDNGGEAWCSPVKRYPSNAIAARAIRKIKCKAGKSDFYEEKIHLDYCSSWQTDETGKYYNDYSGATDKNPVLEHQYTMENPIDFAINFVQQRMRL